MDIVHGAVTHEDRKKLVDAFLAFGKDYFRHFQFVRPTPIHDQIEILERGHKIAFRAVRRGALPYDDLRKIQGAIRSLRLIQRLCVDKEITGSRQIIELLAAELDQEYRETATTPPTEE